MPDYYPVDILRCWEQTCQYVFHISIRFFFKSPSKKQKSSFLISWPFFLTPKPWIWIRCTRRKTRRCGPRTNGRTWRQRRASERPRTLTHRSLPCTHPPPEVNYIEVSAKLDFPCRLEFQPSVCRGNQPWREPRYSSHQVVSGPSCCKVAPRFGELGGNFEPARGRGR